MRTCLRGCVIPDRHGPMCPGAACTGCLPAVAEVGAVICERCIRALRDTLTITPALCAHLRSMLNPGVRAQAFEQDKHHGGKLSHSPAPLNVDLVDAGTEVIRILEWWAGYFGDTTRYKVTDGFPSRATPSEAYGVAKWASDFLLFRLDQIVNDAFVVMFARRVIEWPDDPDEWTIRKALARFPFQQQTARTTGTWASAPCPMCDFLTVMETPSAVPGEAGTFQCRACWWVPPVDELDEWNTYFERAKA